VTGVEKTVKNQKAGSNGRSFDLFERNMDDLTRLFVALMNSGKDFTLKAEIRGNQGRLEHFRITPDQWDRPLWSDGQDYQKKIG